MNWRLKLIIVAAALLLVVLAFFLTTKIFNNDDNSINIGFIAPLTGELSETGNLSKKVIQLAVDEINNEGGISGRLLKVIYEDGGCNSEDAANSIQKLINSDQVKLVIGGFCDTESIAAVPLATANQVLLLSFGSGSPDLTGASQFFVRDYPSNALQGHLLAKIAFEQKRWRHVAFIQEQLDQSLAVFNAFKKTFEDLGGSVTVQEPALDNENFPVALATLKNDQPDALFINVQNLASGEKILKQLRDLKWSISLFVSSAISQNPEFVSRNAGLLEGSLTAAFVVDSKNSQSAKLYASYKNQYGEDLIPSIYNYTAYDAVYLLRDAISEVGYDPEKISIWLRLVKNWPGASGPITINDNGDRVSGYVPQIIIDGKVISITSTP